MGFLVIGNLRFVTPISLCRRVLYFPDGISKPLSYVFSSVLTLARDLQVNLRLVKCGMIVLGHVLDFLVRCNWLQVIQPAFACMSSFSDTEAAMALWLCGCMAVWLYDCVAVWVCGCMAV